MGVVTGFYLEFDRVPTGAGAFGLAGYNGRTIFKLTTRINGDIIVVVLDVNIDVTIDIFFERYVNIEGNVCKFQS